MVPISDHPHKDALLSVVILSYNSENFITQCINGIRIQVTNFKFEVLICDDASQDGTRKAIKSIISEEWTENIQVRTFFHETNLGAWNNLMFGIEHASGQYIAYLEADDYWTKNNKLQVQLDTLRQNQTLVGVADACQFVSETGNNIPNKYFNWVDPKLISFTDCWYYPGFQSSGLVFDRNKLRNPPLSNSNILNDKRLICFLLLEGSVYYTATQTVAYRYHKLNLTSTTPRLEILIAHLRWNLFFLRFSGFKHMGQCFIQSSRMIIHYFSESLKNTK